MSSTVVPIVPSSSATGGNTKTPVARSKSQISPSKNWVFTFNNYTKEHISSIVPLFNEKCNKYIFQEERGEQGTPHLQGYCSFKTKLRPLSLGLPSSIHWEKRKGTEVEAIEYCRKTETRVGEVYTNIRFPKPIKIITHLYKYQEKLNKILTEEPDDRTIYWIYEKEGNVGKSAFCKYLAVKHNALILSGKASDMKYGIVSYTENNEGITPEIIVIDCPRTNLNYLSYTGIEEIKNGLFFNSKYESKMFIMNSPHLIIFANEEPEKHNISMDRWKVFEIIDKDLIPV